MAHRRFKTMRRGLNLALARELTRFRENEIALIVIAALAGFVIGAVVSVIDGAVVELHYLIFGVPLDAHLSAGREIPAGVRFFAPVAGGILVGLIAATIRHFRPREIVDAIEANALYGGRMSLRDSIHLGLLTIVSVGFGGSAGFGGGAPPGRIRFRLENRKEHSPQTAGSARACGLRLGGCHLSSFQ